MIILLLYYNYYYYYYYYIVDGSSRFLSSILSAILTAVSKLRETILKVSNKLKFCADICIFVGKYH